MSSDIIDISIIDTGVGIEEDNLGKIFDAFSKVDDEQSSVLNP